MLRVCHLGKYYPPARGGIESHVRDLAQAQTACGAQVRVICFGHGPGPTHVEQDGRVEVLRIQPSLRVGKLDVSLELPRILRQLEADVVHLHVPNPAMILALLGAKAHAPLVVSYHSDHVNQRFTKTAFRPLERIFYRKAAAILTASPTYAEGSDLLSHYPNRQWILPYGIDLERHTQPSDAVVRAAQGIRDTYTGPRWFFCGRLVRYKGLTHAIQAMQSTPGTLLIGGEGPDRHKLEAETRHLHLEKRVAFLGDVADPIPYYQAAHAFWLPSVNRAEAFGIVQLEAMASGCPVINTDIPDSGVPWVSPDGCSGLTVPPADPQALAAAALRLADDPALRERLSEGARRRASEFTHHRMAQRSLEIYARLLADRSPLGTRWASAGES